MEMSVYTIIYSVCNKECIPCCTNRKRDIPMTSTPRYITVH